MRKGGSPKKGSSFERLVCVQLSLWISNATRVDLFARNVLSGGAHTVHAKRGEKRYLPGDIIAIDPLSHPFSEKFSVECKHYRDLKWAQLLYDVNGKSFLAKIMAKAEDQARAAGLWSLVIAKQNNWPATLLLTCPDWICSRWIDLFGRKVPFHTFHYGCMMVRLEDFFKLAPDLVLGIPKRQKPFVRKRLGSAQTKE
jgi:hypothetical protein